MSHGSNLPAGPSKGIDLLTKETFSVQGKDNNDGTNFEASSFHNWEIILIVVP